MSLHISDESIPSSTAATALRPSTPDKLDDLLSPDEPLPPPRAARDDIHLLIQSPYRLFLYWSHARDPYETLRRALGEAAAQYQLIIRLFDVDNGEARSHPASMDHTWWFDVSPAHGYRAEVGFFAEGKPFVHLLSSEVTRTPAISVAPESDVEPEFQDHAEGFAHLLNESGYAKDALTVALEAVDDSDTETNTRTLAHSLEGSDAPALEDADLPELRSLVAALALGENPAQARAHLSHRLARWLDSVLNEHGGEVDASRLLESLREMFGFELEYDETFVLTKNINRVSSFTWGASDVRQPSRSVRVWMPSMTLGRPDKWLPSMDMSRAREWMPSMSVGQRLHIARWRHLSDL